jgi:hypothetical protein
MKKRSIKEETIAQNHVKEAAIRFDHSGQKTLSRSQLPFSWPQHLYIQRDGHPETYQIENHASVKIFHHLLSLHPQPSLQALGTATLTRGKKTHARPGLRSAKASRSSAFCSAPADG